MDAVSKDWGGDVSKDWGAEAAGEPVAPEFEEGFQGGLMKPVDNPLWGGDVASIKVTRDVNLPQLLWEIDEKLGDRTKYHVVLETSKDDQPVSAKNPLLVHVHPGDTDMRTVNSVVKAHVPDADWGKSEEQKEIEGLKARLLEGDLALPELNKILRSILGG